VRLVRSSLRLALCVCALGATAACGGGAAAPTQTIPPPTTGSSAVPAPSPQRPPLASPAASPSASASSAATPTTAATEAGSQTYEVQPGDTLATIAQQFYSDPTLWRRIYDANAETIGSDPDKLKVGMQLTIPPKP